MVYYRLLRASGSENSKLCMFVYVVCVCVCVCLNAHMCFVYMQEPVGLEEGVGFPGTVVTDHCELPDIGARN